ncbi:hypothetical protein COP2_036647 [Malus domestica]
MAHTYNHASAEAMTYQGKPPTATPYQQVGSGSQIQPNKKTSTFQTATAPPPALLNTLPSQQTYQSQGKMKDFHHHQSHFSKRSKGHYRDNQGYRHDNPRPQAVNTVGQACVRTSPTLRYEAFTPLNATCVAIYLITAHLIPKPKLRQPDYKPMKNTGTFCCYHKHNDHDGEKCITLCDHIEALAREGKLINSSFTFQGVTVTNAR